MPRQRVRSGLGGAELRVQGFGSIGFWVNRVLGQYSFGSTGFWVNRVCGFVFRERVRCLGLRDS